MRVHRSATKTARRSGAALLQADPLIHPLLPIRLAYPSAPRHAWPTGFRLAQYDLALRRFLRLSELAIGDDYGAAILAPRRSAPRASQGPSICRAATYLAMP